MRCGSFSQTYIVLAYWHIKGTRNGFFLLLFAGSLWKSLIAINGLIVQLKNDRVSRLLCYVN